MPNRIAETMRVLATHFPPRDNAEMIKIAARPMNDTFIACSLNESCNRLRQFFYLSERGTILWPFYEVKNGVLDSLVFLFFNGLHDQNLTPFPEKQVTKLLCGNRQSSANAIPFYEQR